MPTWSSRPRRAEAAEFDAVLTAARAGAEWALAWLYRDLQPWLLRYFQAQEPTEADDLASQVWLDVAHALDRFEGDEDAFRRWFFTIARRRLLDLRRRATRRRTDAVRPEDFETLVEPAGTEDAAFAAMSTQAALACVATLPAREREVVLLRVLGGLSAEAVAAITGLRPGTVRVLQHRGLRRLADLLTRMLVTL